MLKDIALKLLSATFEDFRTLLGCLQINLLETWYDERYCF